MEFTAEMKGKELTIKPIIERSKNGDVTIHVPSFSVIEKMKQEYGIRNIQ
jgi:hypothetical protein